MKLFSYDHFVCVGILHFLSLYDHHHSQLPAAFDHCMKIFLCGVNIIWPQIWTFSCQDIQTVCIVNCFESTIVNTNFIMSLSHFCAEKVKSIIKVSNLMVILEVCFVYYNALPELTII